MDVWMLGKAAGGYGFIALLVCVCFLVVDVDVVGDPARKPNTILSQLIIIQPYKIYIGVSQK